MNEKVGKEMTRMENCLLELEAKCKKQNLEEGHLQTVNKEQAYQIEC